jgi:hypothetical protein
MIKRLERLKNTINKYIADIRLDRLNDLQVKTKDHVCCMVTTGATGSYQWCAAKFEEMMIGAQPPPPPPFLLFVILLSV